MVGGGVDIGGEVVGVVGGAKSTERQTEGIEPGEPMQTWKGPSSVLGRIELWSAVAVQDSKKKKMSISIRLAGASVAACDRPRFLVDQ
jgi:hypothetical protein